MRPWALWTAKHALLAAGFAAAAGGLSGVALAAGGSASADAGPGLSLGQFVLSLVISLVPERDCKYNLTDPIEWARESPQGPRRPGRHRHTARPRACGRAVPAVGRVAAGAGRLQRIGERGLPPRYRPVRTAAAPAHDHRRSSDGSRRNSRHSRRSCLWPSLLSRRSAHPPARSRASGPSTAGSPVRTPPPARSPTHAGWRRTSRRSSVRSGGSTCQTGRRRIRASAGRELRWSRWTPRRGRRSAS